MKKILKMIGSFEDVFKQKELIALMTKQIKPPLIVLEYLKTRHSIFLQKKLANEVLNILAY